MSFQVVHTVPSADGSDRRSTRDWATLRRARDAAGEIIAGSWHRQAAAMIAPTLQPFRSLVLPNGSKVVILDVDKKDAALSTIDVFSGNGKASNRHDDDIGVWYMACPAPNNHWVAERAVDWCANDLRVSPTPIVWCTEETEHERAYAAKWGVRDWKHLPPRPARLLGAYDSDSRELWLTIGRDNQTILETVAHEMRHHEQYMRGTHTWASEEYREADAEKYARRVLTRLRTGVGVFGP